MYRVVCPVCGVERLVKAKKSWMQGEEPYSKICKSCVQKGKEVTDEFREKMSVIMKELQTPEELERKRQFMKDHPELQENLQPELGRGFFKGKKKGPHSAEIKRKIGEGVKKAKEKKS